MLLDLWVKLVWSIFKVERLKIWGAQIAYWCIVSANGEIKNNNAFLGRKQSFLSIFSVISLFYFPGSVPYQSSIIYEWIIRQSCINHFPVMHQWYLSYASVIPHSYINYTSIMHQLCLSHSSVIFLLRLNLLLSVCLNFWLSKMQPCCQLAFSLTYSLKVLRLTASSLLI